MTTKKREPEGSPRLIKRYGNRRLYDTAEHRCISRDELAELARARIEFIVHDARTGEDLTQATLLALLTEGSAAVSASMPIDFLRELATFQRQAVRSFFEVALPEAFRTYMKLGEKAASAFTPVALKGAKPAGDEEQDRTEGKAPGSDAVDRPKTRRSSRKPRS